jgi:hypothetical protein
VLREREREVELLEGVQCTISDMAKTEARIGGGGEKEGEGGRNEVLMCFRASFESKVAKRVAKNGRNFLGVGSLS